MARYAAQEDGSITYADADDITVVEPITKPVQTAGGYTRHEPDHETAALMAAAPELLEALKALEALAWPHLLYKGQPTGETVRMTAGEIAISNAREAIARATNPDYVQNSIGQTRDRIMDPLLDIAAEIEAAEAYAKEEPDTTPREQILRPGDRVMCDGREYTLKEKNPDNSAEWLAKRPQAMGFYVLHNCCCRRIEAF